MHREFTPHPSLRDGNKFWGVTRIRGPPSCRPTIHGPGNPGAERDTWKEGREMNCSTLGCTEAAIVIFERTPVRLHWGEEIYVDLGFCDSCEDAYIDEPWRDNLWPAGLPADPPAMTRIEED